uniref:Cytochrome P450 6PZ28 short isoform n=1 Tax=Maconellicoccus hirsutus TaxID=177089 RepID=A0AAT9UTI8_MACHI
MYVCAFLTCSIVLLCIHFHNVFGRLCLYFERHGIPYVKPLPLFGNALDWILMKKPLPMIHYDLYRQLEPHRFGGMFFGWKKQILIRDLDLIQNILVKDFCHFQNRNTRPTSPSNILDKQLFLLQDEEWKNLRSKLTNTFTSGKMKIMFPLVRDCGMKLHKVMENLTDEDIRIKEICARYGTDVIGSCAFGLEINSLENPDSIFRQMGKRALEVGFLDILRIVFPKLDFFTKLFRNKKYLQDFFFNLVKDTVRHREDHNIVRGDFLDLLIELKHNTHKDFEGNSKLHVEMTDELMTAQCFIFFIAGFETSSSTLNFMLMELAQNHHIQNKLRDEIITVLENNNNELTYEAMKQMKYMDMVIDGNYLRRPPLLPHLCSAF